MKKLILMDCNGELCSHAAFLLGLAGYEVCLTRGLVEALNLISLARETEQEYSALLLNDLNSEDELTFLLEICRKRAVRLPVILITGREPEKFKGRVSELGEVFPGISLCHQSEILDHLPVAINGEISP